jgi:outer membrane protein
VRGCVIALILFLGGIRSAGAIDLMEAYQSALDHDAQFAAQASAAQAGREYLRQSRAALAPRVNLSGQALNRDSELRLNTADGGSSILKPSSGGYTYGYSISVTRPLYRPDAVADSRQLAAQGEISAITFRAAQQDLILRVAEAYFGVLLAQDSLAFATAQKEAVAEQLAGAQARFDSGRARVTDVAEAQASFDSLKAAEIAAHSDLEVARARFYSLTGRQGEDPTPLGSYERAVMLDMPSWVDRARGESLDVQVKERELAMAEAEVNRTRLAGRLSVDLVAKFEDNYQDGDLSSVAYPDHSRGTSVGVQFSMPIFAGGALQSRYRQAVYQRDQARLELEATRRDVEVSIQQAYTGVTAGAQRVSALEVGLASAQTSLEAGELGLEVGTRTNLDVLTLQQQVFDAKRNLADARYDYLMSRLQLSAIAGELTTQDLRRLNDAIAQ